MSRTFSDPSPTSASRARGAGRLPPLPGGRASIAGMVAGMVSLAFGLALAGFGCSPLGTERLPVMSVTVGGAFATVEVAATPQTRARGLMYRGKLEADSGMLFVYPSPRRLQYWMKNTLIPLDIGYFDADAFLIEVHRMQPQPTAKDEDLRVYVSGEPAQYALEMNAGWYEKRGLKKYAVLKLPRPVTAVDD